MQLIDNAGIVFRNSWANRVFGLIFLLPVVWAALPADIQAHVPAAWVMSATGVLAAIGAVLRVLKQSNLLPEVFGEADGKPQE